MNEPIVDEAVLEEDQAELPLVELTDANGRVLRFRFLAALEHDDSTYVVLADLEPQSEHEDEIVLLRVDSTADGKEQYTMIEKEEEIQAVFEKYVAYTLGDAVDGLDDTDVEEGEEESPSTVLH